MRCGVAALSMLTFVGCAQQDGVPTISKSSASSVTSVTTPSNTITGGTPVVTATYTRGSLYGSCLRALDSSFVTQNTDTSASYPIQNFLQNSEPTCASGFQLVTDSVVQMNCSSTPGPNGVVPCYWKSQKCAKLAGSDAAEVYQAGATYGMCLRKLGNDFQPTYADPGVYPITSCAASGTPTCAAGFKLVSDAPVQMNCSSTPTTKVEPCYFQAQRCIKL